MKDQFFRIITILLLASVTLSCKPSGKENEKINIIYIMSDDHASHAISAYGGLYKDVAPTPNIDKLATEGILFTNTFCTNSICGPSRAAILTGKYSHKNGFYQNEGGQPFDGNQTTFPKLLKSAGYTTAVIGKWHLWSTPQGFDYFKYHSANGEQGTYWNPIYNDNGVEKKESGYATNLTTDFALDWIKNKRDKQKPFCLLFQFKAPHRPWRPDSIYQDLFEGIAIPYPETFNDDYTGRELTAGNTMMTIENHLNRRDLKLPLPDSLSGKALREWEFWGNKGEYFSPSDTLRGEELKKWKYQRYIKDYLSCIRSVDDNIGRLLSYLDESGLSENTMLVYTGDQGFYLGDHGWYDKRFMYEESLRMPFIVKHPHSKHVGVQEDKMILNIDFAPTFLELAGVSIPREIQGSSFTPLLVGKEIANERTSIYYHYYEFPKWHHVQPHFGVRTDRYKLIHFYFNVDVWELYDLKSDPNELDNLINVPEYESIVTDLKSEIKKLQVQYEDDISLEEMREITTQFMVEY